MKSYARSSASKDTSNRRAWEHFSLAKVQVAMEVSGAEYLGADPISALTKEKCIDSLVEARLICPDTSTMNMLVGFATRKNAEADQPPEKKQRPGENPEEKETDTSVLREQLTTLAAAIADLKGRETNDRADAPNGNDKLAKSIKSLALARRVSTRTIEKIAGGHFVTLAEVLPQPSNVHGVGSIGLRSDGLLKITKIAPRGIPMNYGEFAPGIENLYFIEDALVILSGSTSVAHKLGRKPYDSFIRDIGYHCLYPMGVIALDGLMRMAANDKGTHVYPPDNDTMMRAMPLVFRHLRPYAACIYCGLLDHPSILCGASDAWLPSTPTPNPAVQQAQQQRQAQQQQPRGQQQRPASICNKFMSKTLVCNFSKKCRFAHKCSFCGANGKKSQHKPACARP